MLEVKEALEEPTDPEQAAGLLKCGMKQLKKILPLDLIGLDAASEVLDQGIKNENAYFDRMRERIAASERDARN